MNRRRFLFSLGAAALARAAAPASQAAAQAARQARQLNLKITKLGTFVVNVGSVNWVFCKVYTNQGLVGLGEGSVTSKESTIVAAIMEHERFLAGKDPTEIELLWQGSTAIRAGAADRSSTARSAPSR